MQEPAAIPVSAIPAPAGRFGKWRTRLIRHGFTVTVCGFLLYAEMWPSLGNSILAFLLCLCLIPWIIINLALALTRHAERVPRLLNIGLWLATLALTSALGDFKAGRDRDFADAAVSNLWAYHDRTGEWPDSLEQAGIKPASRSGATLHYRRYDNDEIDLSYWNDHQTSFGWNRYEYDFNKKEWTYVAD